MEEKGKKVKIELSKLTLIFIVLFGLCLLVWTFIFGAWIGSKIAGKREKLEIATEKQVHPLSNFTPSNITSSNFTPANITTTPTNVTTYNVTVASNVSSNVTSNEVVVRTQEKFVAKKETAPSHSPKDDYSKKESTKYQKKEVAQIASVIKKEETPKVSNRTSQTSYYTLQVGAFSSINSVESFKDILAKKGYQPIVEKTTIDGKTWYRVYVGKYSTKEEAQKYASEVKSKLGLEKILVVELK